jgi:hypothetical protein
MRRRLSYSVQDAPSTVHDLLLQKSTGQLDLVVWNERVTGSDAVTINFGGTHQRVKIYDIVSGTMPIPTLNHLASVHLSLSDHAVVVELDDE